MDNVTTNAKQFERIDHQFGVIDRRFERTEFRTTQRFDDIESHLDRHDRQLIELKDQITDLAIMTKMEFDRVDERFQSVDNRFKSIDKRFDTLEQLIKQGFERTDKLEKLVKQGFEKTDKLEQLVKQGFGIV